MRLDKKRLKGKRERKKKSAIELVKQEWIRLGNIRRFVG